MLRHLRLLILACVMMLPAATAQAADASKLFLPDDITVELAHKAVAAAVEHAQQKGFLMNVAVVDAGGNLKAFVRMDGAFLASIDISIRKAKTARSLNMSTLDLSKQAQPGQPLYGIEVLDGTMAVFGGGELLKNKDGLIIGAIGVSGDSVENDVETARAGAAALQK